MCVSAIMAGAAIASGVVQGTSAILNYNEQEKQDKANKRAAAEAAQTEIQQVTARQQQMRQNASRSIFEANLEAKRADAITRVSAGENGISGASLDMILNDIERQRLQATTDEQVNLQNLNDQTAVERKGIQAQMRGRMNQTTAPNPWATAIQIGGGAINATTSIYGRLPT